MIDDSTFTKANLTPDTFRGLLGNEILVRYQINRFDRTTNNQDFYAELVDLYPYKAGDKFILRHLRFRVEVGLNVKDTNVHSHIPDVLDYTGLGKKIPEILDGWGKRPSPWRKEQGFVGLLQLGAERVPLSETSGLCGFYHAHIARTLRSLVEEMYIRTRGNGEPVEQYDAIQQMDARFGAFAATNYIKGVVARLNDV
jgi:hypothetical protein